MLRTTLAPARLPIARPSLPPTVALRLRLLHSTPSTSIRRTAFLPPQLPAEKGEAQYLRSPRNPQEVFVTDDWHAPPPPRHPKLPLDTVVEVHPLLGDDIDLTNLDKEFVPRRWMVGDDYEDWGDENAWGFAAIDEYATKPSCRKLRIEVGPVVFPIVRDPRGVKVRQVYKEMVRHWAKRPLIEADEEEEIRQMYARHKMGPIKITNRTLLFDHNGFTGFQRRSGGMGQSCSRRYGSIRRLLHLHCATSFERRDNPSLPSFFPFLLQFPSPGAPHIRLVL
ncbi:hypothetical protein AAT19DRAFT_11407 [Rhodotorula toruloides]|uniref:FGENESH: predicted gene_16.52 protein n=1 Tax=Rhodotorula toruloides TaxID=5286 RepID=A0A0K3CRN5_RHOTO|nr:hypothetical protein AAT19DRAFT_11407 [Rhodotorula toruloides]